MAVKSVLTRQEDFTGEIPAEWAASGLWRFNEAEPDENDRLMDSSGQGRAFNIINWSGTTASMRRSLKAMTSASISITLLRRKHIFKWSTMALFLPSWASASWWEAG